MDQQKRIDRILDAINTRVEEEVAGLLGTEFTIVDSKRTPIKKGDAFEQLMGKQVCAHVDITGEISGVGCLLVGIKDAIRLGGTLIMLPASELEEVCGREDYTEEIADSYGEIANIIAGSFSKEFEESYPTGCRFIRKEQEVLVPAKVDEDADSPVPPGIYYQVQFSMLLEGKQMGDLVCLIPAETFELSWPELEDQGEEEPQTESPDVAEPVETAQTSGEETAADKAPVEPRPKFNYEKHKKRLDRLLEECCNRTAEEVGALMGVDLDLIDLQNRLLSKEEFLFEQMSGKQVMADMDVVGELEDKSYLFVSLKDAIHLGGILVMLPPSELETVVADEDFNEDLNDAYGEVANIISGVYTAIFEEQYTKKLRFIKKELHEIHPLKVEVESAEPMPDISYYVSSMGIIVEGKTLGQMHMAFPAEMLQVSEADQIVKGGDTQESSPKEKTAAQPDGDAGGAQGETPDRSAAEQPAPKADKLNIEKHKKRVDKLLTACQAKLSDEVSALLGAQVELKNINNGITDKEDFFFDRVSGKQVVTKMDVVGELEGVSFLSVDLKDAIRIGGVLIMLPDAELDTAVGDEEFSEDVQDAFGEIANIISGVYTQVFEEQYLKKLRFIKTGHEIVVPMKVDVDSDEPIAADNYYLSSMDIILDGDQLGKISLLVPLDLLQLTPLLHPPEEAATADDATAPQSSGAGEESAGPGDLDSVDGSWESDSPDVLVIRDDEKEADKIAFVLRKLGHRVKLLSFKDSIQNYLPGEVKAVYLVMKDVNEQAFGMAIKINSVSMVPLIAAGPSWTRSKVIKAVKYGVRDILLTPATQEDVEENVNNNLMQKAA